MGQVHGNLAVVVTADSGVFLSSMYTARDVARESMLRSSEAVDAFQANMDRRSMEMQEAMHRMGGASREAAESVASMADQTKASVNAMTEAVNDAKFDSVGEKVAAAVGAGMGAGYAATESWLHKTEEFVKTRLEIVGVAILTGVAVATVGALYLAYKSATAVVGFVEGLFTGDSYKSKSIDALIAQNQKVVELQKSLHISAVEAGALGDALARLGVSKDDYVKVHTDAGQAMKNNQEELDRLGVKYQDQNKHLLDTQTFLQNVKKKLEEYKDGWDRSQAAAAIGAGSYEKVNETLRASQEEVQKSKERLDDYNLGIGPESQAAVEKYQDTMRQFNNELKLTSEGFSRAWADQILPVLTDLADFFKDGFPFAVNAFRYTMATVTSLFYGLKTSAYIVSESILGGFEAIGSVIAGVGKAVAALVTGDFAGAHEALVHGMEQAQARIAKIGDNIVAMAEHNKDAMKLAWAFDDRQDPTAGKKDEGTKTWHGKPEDKAVAASAFDKYMEEIQRMTTKVDQGAIAEMKAKAQALADAEDRMNSSRPQIDAFRNAKEAELMKAYTKGLEQQNEQYAFQTTLVGQTAAQQEILNLKHKNDIELQAKIADHERTIGPLTAESRAAMIAYDHKMTDAMIANIEARRAKEREWATGAKSAMDSYIDNATNTAQQANQVFSTAFKGMEDAIVNFTKTGKLNFTSLADTIVTMLIRIATQKAIAGMVGSLFGPPGGGLSQPTYGTVGLTQANGGAWINGVQAFADGGVVSSPTVFPFAGGTGLMGEAGPEAIMPLKRGADGKLGVAASSSGGAPVFHTTIVIKSDGASSTQTNGSGAGKQAADSFNRMANQWALDQMRPGGLLAGAHA